jgi:hypothetical protein
MAIKGYSYFKRIISCRSLISVSACYILIDDYFFNKHRAANCSVLFTSLDDSLAAIQRKIEMARDREGYGDREGDGDREAMMT